MLGGIYNYIKRLWRLKTSENNLRSNSLEWFFALSEQQKNDLKEKYFKQVFIPKDSHWGYHFTFEQIEKMYLR